MKVGDHVKIDDGTVVLLKQLLHGKDYFNPVPLWSTKVIYVPEGCSLEVGQSLELYELWNAKVVKLIFVEE
jgi:hypothetical protein